MKPLFLWPRPRHLEFRHLVGKPVSAEEIEIKLKDYFPDAWPVLFSSARAALSAILNHLELSRPDLVWCPPYSSHCVFETIARTATPTTESITPTAALIYHQWGHINHSTFPQETILIEDAVDTLFAPGENPFAIGGRYALWSLPKTVASLWGGVAFCRSEEDAVKIRHIRDRRPTPFTLQAWLRLLGERFPSAHAYWHGVESTGGRLPSFALHHIFECLKALPEIVDQRRHQLALLQPYSLAPPPLRLPSCLPLPAEAHPDTSLLSGQQLTAGLRSFNFAGVFPSPQWQKVFPAPIHQDTSGTDVAEFVAKINLQPPIQSR